MLALLFYQNNVRAASFVGIDRAPAGTGGGNRILLKKVLDVVIATIAIALSAPLMVCMALAINPENRGPIIIRRKTTGLNGLIFEIWNFSKVRRSPPYGNHRMGSNVAMPNRKKASGY
jgi:lipopolysaccharide/colanic/teichoic acid biosynthesis glycosyltransferase